MTSCLRLWTMKPFKTRSFVIGKNLILRDRGGKQHPVENFRPVLCIHSGTSMARILLVHVSWMVRTRS